MKARRGWAHLWLAGAVCGVAFAMWHHRRRQRAIELELHPRLPRPLASSAPSSIAARPAWRPPASVDEAQTWAVPPHASQHTPPHAAWLHRASVAIHLGQASELARIARELDAEGYPAAAGVLDNYVLLLRRPTASRSRILVEVTRLLSTALADPPSKHARSRDRRANQARTSGVDAGQASAGTSPSSPMLRGGEALPGEQTFEAQPGAIAAGLRPERARPIAMPMPSPGQIASPSTPRSLLALVDRRRAGR